MIDKNNHKKVPVELLSGRVPLGLPDQFRETVPEGFKIGCVLAAAVRLWIDLPEEVRHQLLMNPQKGFVEAVEEIVRNLQSRTKGKPPKKRHARAR